MLIQTISKDEYLQESINNILNSIPLNTWEVNFSVDVCIGDSETVGFEIAFHDEDVVENEIYGFKTNQMDINVMGVIRKKI